MSKNKEKTESKSKKQILKDEIPAPHKTGGYRKLQSKEDLYWKHNMSRRSEKEFIEISTILTEQNIDSLDFQFTIRIHSKSESTMVGVVKIDHGTDTYIGNCGIGWSWYCEYGNGYARGGGKSRFYGITDEHAIYKTGDLVTLRINKNKSQMYYKKNKGEFKILFDSVISFPEDGLLKIACTVQKNEDVELVEFKDNTMVEGWDEDMKERVEFLNKNYELNMLKINLQNKGIVSSKLYL